MKKPQAGASLSAAAIRRLAVAADVDPRTMRKVLEGGPVRGMAAERARAAIAAANAVDAEESRSSARRD